MPSIKAPSKVLVTGASGFIAVATLKALVNRGFNVVGTVRSNSKGEYLEKLLGPLFTYAIVEDIESVCQFSNTLEVTQLIDQQPDAFDKVVKSGEFAGVVHMASPVTVQSSSPPDVIGPAVAGTKNILSAVLAYGSVLVTRSFLMSSN